jgi:hypothetical protein
VVDGRETLQHDLFELSTEIQRNGHPTSITAINSDVQATCAIILPPRRLDDPRHR